MDKLELVEESFGNGEQIVFYDQDKDTIWVCFGGVEMYKDEHTIQFKDCSQADIQDGQEEYYGELIGGSYDVYFNVDCELNDNFIPTIFYKGELMEIIKQ